jgi:hypothetical protein
MLTTMLNNCFGDNINIVTLAALLTAHLAADFLLQSNSDVQRKREVKVFLKHIAWVTGLSYILLGVWTAWLTMLVVITTHALADWVKLKRGGNTPTAFWIDQLAHIVVIVFIAANPQWFGSDESFWLSKCGIVWTKALIFVDGLLTAVFAGGVAIGLWAQPFLEEMRKLAKPDSLRGFEKGGKTIGQLERGLVFFLVLIGKPEAVAFLVAAKSIFRFGELSNHENRMEAEYITIGTLMSFTWGFAIAWITHALLSLL